MTEQTKIIESAKAFLQDPDGALLLIRRSLDDEYRPGQWDLPGGELLVGEKPLQAVCRETLEETGLLVSRQREEADYYSSKPSRLGHVNRRHFYHFVIGYGGVVLGDEHIETKRASVIEADNLLLHTVQRSALRHMVAHGIIRAISFAP